MDAAASRGRPILAVFDFDGTLTERDSSLPFLAFAAGSGRLAASVFLQGPFLLLADAAAALAGALRAHDGPPALRDRWELAVHRRLLRTLFRGRSRAELRELGRRFAEALDVMVAPEALAQVAWHRARGDRCVLVTGSLDTYMEPWGARVGFERVLATRLAHDGAETVLGGFDGAPCWGEAKVARLREAVGELGDYTLVVYGNEPSDRPLLDAADHAVRIRPGASWAPLAARVREVLA